MMKYTVLMDPGHGGMVAGQYVTPGKRSPKFPDGTQLFEGVNNRDNVNRMLAIFKERKISAVDIVNSQDDVGLTQRCKRANDLHVKSPCVYVSIHSDASGDGVNWDTASGISVYTSPGQTKSDVLAALVIDELELQFGNTVKWRKDTTDGDEDKEAHFQVLTGTNCPSILIEAGFHTNLEEAKRMLTDEWKNKLAVAVVNGVEKFNKL